MHKSCVSHGTYSQTEHSCWISSRSKHRTLSACHPHALFQLICLPPITLLTQNTHYPDLCLRSVLPDFELQIIYLCVSDLFDSISCNCIFMKTHLTIDGHPGYLNFGVWLVMMLWICLYMCLGEHMFTYLLSMFLVKLVDCRNVYVPF